MGGFIARSDDIADLANASKDENVESLRLGNLDGNGYAKIEVPEPNLDMVSNAGAPKSTEFWNGGTDRLVIEEYPYVGNGMIATVTDRVRPEFHFGKVSPTGHGDNIMLDMPLGTTITKYADDGTVIVKKRYDGIDQVTELPIWTQATP
jgi:hypothetical protein